MFTMNMDRLDLLIDDITRLQSGYKLLEEVYLDISIDGKICYGLEMKLKDFFQYDDSE